MSLSLRGRMLALAAAGGLCLAVAPPTQASVSTGGAVGLDFADQSPEAVVTTTLNLGTAPVTTSVTSSYGGVIGGAASFADQGTAVRFPAFNASKTAPRAVLTIRSVASDELSPGDRDFSWGADFAVDAVSESSAKTSKDNGDNLVQRGIAGTRAQFKLQLDKHQPSCRLETSAGHLLVTLPVTVTPGAWYQASCTRTGSVLTTTLSQYDATGAVVQTWSRSATKSLGPLTWTNPLVPLTVGGKLYETGALVPSTDQFNGSVDNVFVTLAS